MHFHATLILSGKTATGIQIPDEVIEQLSAGKRLHVLSVEDAKTSETRQRRVEKVLATLRGGR
jgi:uncharacterized protein YdeI (YjbR/CyaY-like superfamily)